MKSRPRNNRIQHCVSEDHRYSYYFHFSKYDEINNADEIIFAGYFPNIKRGFEDIVIYDGERYLLKITSIMRDCFNLNTLNSYIYHARAILVKIINKIEQ